MIRPVTMLVAALCLASAAHAGEEALVAGTLVPDYGKYAPREDARLPEGIVMKVAFDMSAAAPKGEISRDLEKVARFLNMHAASGIARENLSAAIVVHGGASADFLTAEKLGHENPNAGIIAELVAAGTRIDLCGTTAAVRDIAQEDLLPGITISLSAMTSHALLQQQGYTLNPF